MNSNSAVQNPQNPSKPIGIGLAILVGQIVVNAPVVLIILFFLLIGFALMANPLINEIIDSVLPIELVIMAPALLSGIFFAWLWWSFSVPRWRRWALRKGASAGRLQKWAVATGLVWAKGSIFEKTEFKVKE